MKFYINHIIFTFSSFCGHERPGSRASTRSMEGRHIEDDLIYCRTLGMALRLRPSDNAAIALDILMNLKGEAADEIQIR